MAYLAKMLIVFGALLLGLGFLCAFFNRIPFLGKLPGDILIKKENLTIYFPLTTSLLISVILSLALWLFSRK